MDNEITIKLDDDGKVLNIRQGATVHYNILLRKGSEEEYPIRLPETVEPWPQEGDGYWYVGPDGALSSGKYDSTGVTREFYFHQRLKAQGNFFRTKEEAQMYSLRIESLSKGFMGEGKNGDWFWNFQHDEPLELFDSFAKKLFVFFPKFPTKEECQEWYNQYGSSWLFLLNNNKK